ncbi:MAG: dihydroneopterin aldolase [Campylobacterales bacterium]|jgi:dihydroneopterin aldolase
MTIEIRSLTFECIIGILDFERVTPQNVVVDAAIDYEYTEGSFLDYAAVAARIKSEMIEQRFELIEEALLSVSATLKADFPAINALELTISKPDILPDCRVCVTKKSNY